MSHSGLSPHFSPAVDALIVGGGPAGIATALALARAGFVAQVLEHTAYEAPRVGEHLSPQCQPLLQNLLLWTRFLASKHLPSPGIRSAWNSAVLDDHDYMFSPYGNGWNVNRRRFDAALAECAAAAGIEVLTATRLAGLSASAGRWLCRLRGGPRDGLEITANFLVDATGRSVGVARRFGARRQSPDRLIGLCAWLSDGDSSAGEDTRLLVEAAENGWWYAAALPDALLTAVFLTDSDLISAGGGDARRLWEAALDSSTHVAARVRRYRRRRGFHIRSAQSYGLQPAAGVYAGARWLAVGDAALALDPLSSMGILEALRSGLEGASAISCCLSGHSDALASYSEGVAQRYKSYLGERSAVYGKERRWPDHPFWRRRTKTS